MKGYVVHNTSNSNVKQATQALIGIINVFGWYAVSKAFLVWRAGPASNQPGWVGRGFTFIVAGIFCTNFYVAADMISRSFGAGALGTQYFSGF